MTDLKVGDEAVYFGEFPEMHGTRGRIERERSFDDVPGGPRGRKGNERTTMMLKGLWCFPSSLITPEKWNLLLLSGKVREGKNRY